MYKLYARKNAGSAAIEAVLELCGAPYTLEDVPRQPDRSIPAWFYKVNPRGEVPTLILPGNRMMTESAAMLIYLGDLYPQAGLAPRPEAAERPRYLRWLVYLATTVYMSSLRHAYAGHYTVDPLGIAGIKARAAADYEREFALFAEALGHGPFLLGEQMSTADIYAAMLVTWAPDTKALLARHGNLKAMCQRVAAHPAIAKVWARNGM